VTLQRQQKRLVSGHHIVIILALRYMRVHRGVRLRPTTNHRLRLHQHRHPLPLAVIKMASTFAWWVIWRSVFLFLGTGSLVKGYG